MKQTTGTMKISDKQLDELAEELRDRTCDFMGEELFELLLEQGIVEETDDHCIDTMNKIFKLFYHPNRTKSW